MQVRNRFTGEVRRSEFLIGLDPGVAAADYTAVVSASPDFIPLTILIAVCVLG